MPHGLGRGRWGGACWGQATAPSGPLSERGSAVVTVSTVHACISIFFLPPPFIHTGRPALPPRSLPRSLPSARRAFRGRGGTTLPSMSVDQPARTDSVSGHGALGVDQPAQRDSASGHRGRGARLGGSAELSLRTQGGGVRPASPEGLGLRHGARGSTSLPGETQPLGPGPRGVDQLARRDLGAGHPGTLATA